MLSTDSEKASDFDLEKIINADHNDDGVYKNIM